MSLLVELLHNKPQSSFLLACFPLGFMNLSYIHGSRGVGSAECTVCGEKS